MASAPSDLGIGGRALLRAVRGAWAPVALAVLCLAGCRASAESESGTADGPGAVAVRVQTMVPTSVDRVERRSGRAEPRRDVLLAFGVPGRVTRVTVDEGDRVKKGALVAAVDVRTLDAQVKQAKAGAERARRELARAQGLRQKKALASQQVDELESAALVAEAQLEAAQAQLDHGKIRAPFEADVVRRMVEPGAWVGPGVPVVALAQLDPIRVVAQVPAHVRPLIAPGATANIEVRGLEAARAGQVVRVSPMADERTGLFRVEIDVANPDRRIAAGQPVEVAMHAGRYEDVFVLEPEWVVYRYDGPAVVVVDDGKARTVPLGDSARVDGRFLVPKDTLPNLPLVIRGQSLAREGAPVRVVDGRDPEVAEGRR